MVIQIIIEECNSDVFVFPSNFNLNFLPFCAIFIWI